MSRNDPKLPDLSAPTNEASQRLNLEAFRARLGQRNHWRSLEELELTPQFQESLHREFPENTVEGCDRRELLKFMGASLALAGLTACTRQPAEKIVPYVRQPEEIVPGKPLFFATAMTLGGYATGLLIESHMGRPTKAEGNPLHPASLGATDAFSQASLYALYDPDRSQTLTFLEEIRPWSAFLGAMRLALEAQRESHGAGLRILTETVSSPTLAWQLTSLLSAFPNAKWHQWEPASRDNARAGARLAFGKPVETVLRIEGADVILSLDGDFLSCGPGHLRYAREFAARRRVRDDSTAMNRLYSIESTPTNTGAVADHRLPLSAGAIEGFARGIAAGLGVASSTRVLSDPFARILLADLKEHRRSSLILAGDHQPPAVHALAHAMNAALESVGNTLYYTDPVEANPVDQVDSLKELVRDMEAGRVETLLILGGNPAFTAPADLPFAAAVANVKLRAHLSLDQNETSALCQWHIPEAHFLESWSDARAFDGTASIVQPLIAPLYNGKSAHEVLAIFSDQPEKSAYELIREHWRPKIAGDFEASWRRALHDGVIEGTALPPKPVTLRSYQLSAFSFQLSNAQRPAPGASRLEIIFRPDPTIHDGRFANNGWLQELPKPLTKLTWDSVAMLSVATAKRLGLTKEEIIELRYRGRSVSAPVWIEPGHPDDAVTVHFGYGRTRAGRLGTRAGFNAYALRTSEALDFGGPLEIVKTGSRFLLASTQEQQSLAGLEERGAVRAAALAEYRRNPRFAREKQEQPGPDLSLYKPVPSRDYAWGMAIDLGTCIGCNACVVACQAENNIPVVGKREVRRGRAMHWLRIDHYYGREPENPEHHFQPVPCMHCENAPCEVVCPTAATVHSAEGLNDMIYNRCVGTRYCSNNCPYKVRRFNFYHYSTQFRAPSLKMLANPDVTVRWRGVMEKCTYCVQRINKSKIEAELENRRVRDGEIVTACQQACPAEAIVFGDAGDPGSRVSRMKAAPLSYGLLAELGTRPRTTYLAKVKNPNPRLEPRAAWAEGTGS